MVKNCPLWPRDINARKITGKAKNTGNSRTRAHSSQDSVRAPKRSKTNSSTNPSNPDTPSTNFIPENEVAFDLDADDLNLNLHSPPRASRRDTGKAPASASAPPQEELLNNFFSRYEDNIQKASKIAEVTDADRRAELRIELATVKQHILDCRAAGKEKRAARLEAKYFKLMDEYHGVSSDEEDE